MGRVPESGRQVSVPFSAEALEVVERDAHRCGVSLSEYVGTAAFGRVFARVPEIYIAPPGVPERRVKVRFSAEVLEVITLDAQRVGVKPSEYIGTAAYTRARVGLVGLYDAHRRARRG